MLKGHTGGVGETLGVAQADRNQERGIAAAPACHWDSWLPRRRLLSSAFCPLKSKALHTNQTRFSPGVICPLCKVRHGPRVGHRHRHVLSGSPGNVQGDGGEKARWETQTPIEHPGAPCPTPKTSVRVLRPPPRPVASASLGQTYGMCFGKNVLLTCLLCRF